ncbi:hypothetical protein [Bacteriovorax sp. DB6_IX]|uniref:hypothetical protein n=1 Tax=Bacteriovorax sp. DB6_IX TaxID=1353530 RepID=UPI00038A3DDD|nr:hypothetical protein [Bacteriovorax sp. DB6_IX]EQC45087.1 hypothetical protein M901_1302 [Bacteriovorax sp. DB6_IX]
MRDRQKFLSITFSKFCMDCAQVNNVTLEEMVQCLSLGSIYKLGDGQLSFRLNSIEVITCSEASVARSVIRHKESVHHLLYKSQEQMSSYEYAMVA